MTGNASPLQTLAELGQSVWYDNIHRQLIESDALQNMVTEDRLSGITSNPSIFEKAIAVAYRNVPGAIEGKADAVRRERA